MSLQLAFEVTAGDVENVLRANIAKIADAQGKPLELMAADIFDDWAGEADRIAEAALAAGTEMDAQTNGAYSEIRLILVEQGILKR